MKLLASIIVIAITAAISLFSVSRSENIKQPEVHHSKHVERIAHKTSVSKTENKPSVPENRPPSLEKLAGHINKEYGIREDILRYIEREIPNNEMAKKAAIKYAQRLNFIYYKATKEEAMKVIKQQWITLKCLRYALKTDKPLSITDGIDNLMNNTPERDKHIWDIDQSYFGWKAIGGFRSMSEEELKEICEAGNY